MSLKEAVLSLTTNPFLANPMKESRKRTFPLSSSKTNKIFVLPSKTTKDYPTSHFGLHIAHDRVRGTMTLDQTAFIDNLLSEHGLNDATGRETPVNTVFPVAICNSLDLQYSSADIRTAFLYPSRPTDPDHSLYIRRPSGATDSNMLPIIKLLAWFT